MTGPPVPPPPAVVAPAPAPEIRVTADEAKERGLPPVGFRMEARGGLRVTYPSDGSAYVVFSGPQGGALSLVVSPFPGDARRAGALREAVEASERRPVAFGAREEVTVDGARREAFLYHTGEKAAAGCPVVVPAGERTVLLLFAVSGTAATVPSCGAVVGHPSLRPLLESLRFEAASSGGGAEG
ncbi:MAG: hypothetical protein L6R30_19490 [Thermoanaerobaculia bacterium]|nr:hypothetical protein [Thermoanaerobaculia bacterium]